MWPINSYSRFEINLYDLYLITKKSINASVECSNLNNVSPQIKDLDRLYLYAQTRCVKYEACARMFVLYTSSPIIIERICSDRSTPKTFNTKINKHNKRRAYNLMIYIE